MDLQLVYGFVPADGSLETLVERKAAELATHSYCQANGSDHAVGRPEPILPKRLQAAVRERTAELKRDMPGMLWD